MARQTPFQRILVMPIPCREPECGEVGTLVMVTPKVQPRREHQRGETLATACRKVLVLQLLVGTWTRWGTPRWHRRDASSHASCAKQDRGWEQSAWGAPVAQELHEGLRDEHLCLNDVCRALCT